MMKKKSGKRNVKNKKKKKNKNFIRVWGIKITHNVLLTIILSVALFMFYTIRTMYVNYKLENGRTEIVFAKIIGVGTRRRGGLGVKPTIGYIKFRYFIKGKEIIHFSESFEIEENIEQYHIGDCIELLISLEDENVYKWNESKGSFKCQ